VLVKDIFWEKDATVILVLLVHEGKENTLAWHCDEHSVFSVKSAYKVCRDELIRRRENDKGQGGSSQAVELIWDGIWKMKCPNKIKHFAWRLVHNSHPLRINLARRGMKIDTKCPLCQRLDEEHLFLKCKMAKQVWRALNLDTVRERLSELASARDVLVQIMKEKEDIRLQCITTL
jgi:hypothetical protein